MWVASDIHLSAQTPLTTGAFLAFLDRAAERADALFLPGDIFDVWIGDDFALCSPPEWLQSVLDALSRTSQHTELYLGRGNRDFLMGEALAQHVGARLLADATRVQTDAGPILLSHGDEYCTADRGYQRFRRIVRQPFIQSLFLKLNLRTRRSIASWARNRSQKHNQYKATAIMDVNPAAIRSAFQASGCPIIVHGHTHRPAIHDVRIDSEDYQRIVLPDWEHDHSQPPRGGWLVIDSCGLALHQYPSAATATS